jgi:hypothetical protein
MSDAGIFRLYEHMGVNGKRQKPLYNPSASPLLQAES